MVSPTFLKIVIIHTHLYETEIRKGEIPFGEQIAALSYCFCVLWHISYLPCFGRGVFITKFLTYPL